MIPKLTILASRGNKLPIHGDGNSVRSYLYVEDVARAFDIILHKGTIGEIYNIGTNKERSVTSVAEDICKIFQIDPSHALLPVRDRAFNDQRYFICDNKLAGLGWQEETTWQDGLSKTVEWYMQSGHDGNYWVNGNIELALEAHPTCKN